MRSKGTRFSGGVVVQFVLFDPSSRILDAGTLCAYSGLRETDETAPKINLIEAVTEVDRRPLRRR